ncbi:MAG: DNA polymerase subunit beta [Desulfurococcales archaeon ex4484_217_1]|nr:MAG: DNA polymerase subunit beta [Desulfurococcales archaeon ex4484_217_1]
MSNYIDTSLLRVKMLKEWKTWVQKIAVRGDYVAGSDVDVLVISPNIPEKMIKRGEIKAEIEEKLNLPYYHPFEIHILRPEEAKPYLKKIGKYVFKVL